MIVLGPVRVQLWPPQLYVRWHGWWHRVHHVWLGLLFALTDILDWRVWWSDLRRRVM